MSSIKIKLSAIARSSSSSSNRPSSSRLIAAAASTTWTSSASCAIFNAGSTSQKSRYYCSSSSHVVSTSITNHVVSNTQQSPLSSVLSASSASLTDKLYYPTSLQTRHSSSSTTPSSTTPSSSSSSSSSPPFRKILIANRGEIAIRILRTAKAHGIQTVAIYSTADANSPHVALADEAVCIGPPASDASYLDIEKVCEAVEMTGSEGVHPGYGFLSENPGFSERVTGAMANDEASYRGSDGDESGGGREKRRKRRRRVKFIGPSAHAIRSLGDKIQSKLIAEAAGVSTIPGYNGAVTSPDHALEVARDIGYPVMIKASGGGGGKGMRICYTDEQLEEGYRLGGSEAKSFFGDDRLLVEKYVEDPHHIEIQVLSGTDPATGELDVLCFPERECSIQRRNQKVIEESPSPHLLPSTRREMIRQVKSLVREVGYESAGTVEFLVDKHQKFYFLEMNTRLQVEHPVTEMISGDGYASNNYVDLVHGMLEVAAGRGIPQKYLDMIDTTSHVDEDSMDDGGEGANVRYTGHAVEARVYAEDPLRGFLPSTGPLVKYVEPPSLLNVDEFGADNGPCHIRIDTGVVPGAIVTPHYDPILSKIISYSPVSREHAILGLGSALDQYLLRGVQHNVPFVRDVLRNDDFVKGHTPTGFIGEHYPDGFVGGQLSEKERREMVVVAREIQRRREVRMDEPPLALLSASSGDEEVVVCLGGIFGDAYLVRSNGDSSNDVTSSVTRLGTDDEDDVEVVNLSALEYEPSDDLAHVKIAGMSRALQVHGDDEIGTLKLTMYGSNADILVMSPAEYKLACHMKEPTPVDLGNFVLSPMPGTLVSFAVKEGDVVELDQELCVLEAMKMQNVIRSHKAGATVGKLYGEVGASLRADEVLLEFEKESEEPVSS